MTDFIRNEERVMKDGKLVEIKYEIKKELFAAWYGEQWQEYLSDVLLDIEDDITKHYPGIYGLPVALALRKLEDTLINNKRIPDCVYVPNEDSILYVKVLNGFFISRRSRRSPSSFMLTQSTSMEDTAKIGIAVCCSMTIDRRAEFSTSSRTKKVSPGFWHIVS